MQTGLVSLPDEILQRFSLTVLWLDHNKLSRLPPEFALLTLLEAPHPAPVANQSAAPVAIPRTGCNSVARLQLSAAVANQRTGCKSAQTVANSCNDCKSAHRFPLSDTLQCDTVQHVATQ